MSIHINMNLFLINNLLSSLLLIHLDNQKTYTMNAPFPMNDTIVRNTIIVCTKPPVAVRSIGIGSFTLSILFSFFCVLILVSIISVTTVVVSSKCLLKLLPVSYTHLTLPTNREV